MKNDIRRMVRFITYGSLLIAAPLYFEKPASLLFEGIFGQTDQRKLWQSIPQNRAGCTLAMSTKPNASASPAAKQDSDPVKVEQLVGAKRPDAARKDDIFTIFITGYELGELKPCGCSGGQLGGLDRRSAIFNSAPKQKRLIIDTGALVETDGEQDLLKFNIIIEAFRLLGYDLVNLTKKDLEIAQNLGLLNNPIMGFISPYGTGEKIAGRFQNQYKLMGKYITISVLTFDPDTSPIQQVREVFLQKPGQQSVNILIMSRCDDAIISTIAKMGIVDCLICPSDSDEPRIIDESTPPKRLRRPDPEKTPLVFSVGRFGRYVNKLEIGLVKDSLKFQLSSIPVTENLPQQIALVELYKTYQQLVNQANLLVKYPRFTLPNGLKYTGSESCQPCHEYEYSMWSVNPHAQAYPTLQKVGSQLDPQCVICHVIGLKYESGFISSELTPHLKDVGCENCHGPGSLHNLSLGKIKTTDPKSTCLDCHTPETSSDYAGNEQLYLEKIIHWTEPNKPANVK